MNAVKFVQLVEGRLGWLPPTQGPRRYVTEAAKVKRKIATNVDLFTWYNLELAVELLVREKQSRSPIGVFAHVERAVYEGVESETDVELEIRKATAYEQERGDPAGWSTRFARAVGAYRAEALREWRESVR